MVQILLFIIYVAFISLGLPDGLLGAGKVTALSVAMTCVALFGFSFSDNILALLLVT